MTNQVRTAIGGVLRQVYRYDQARPLPDHLTQLLRTLDVRSEGSSSEYPLISL